MLPVRVAAAGILAVAVLLAAAPADAARRTPRYPRVVAARKIRAPHYGSGLDLPARGEEPTFVARDAETWRTFWLDLGYSETDIPRVDFDRRMVVGLFSGGVDSCHGFRLASARVGRSGAVVAWNRTYADGCICLTAVWANWKFATIPRTDGPVRFREGPLLVSHCEW